MTEAYIVATARSPIGRAYKGSLAGVRADDGVVAARGRPRPARCGAGQTNAPTPVIARPTMRLFMSRVPSNE